MELEFGRDELLVVPLSLCSCVSAFINLLALVVRIAEPPAVLSERPVDADERE